MEGKEREKTDCFSKSMDQESNEGRKTDKIEQNLKSIVKLSLHHFYCLFL